RRGNRQGLQACGGKARRAQGLADACCRDAGLFVVCCVAGAAHYRTCGAVGDCPHCRARRAAFGQAVMSAAAPLPNETVAEWESEGLALGERERSAQSLMSDIGDW